MSMSSEESHELLHIRLKHPTADRRAVCDRMAAMVAEALLLADRNGLADVGIHLNAALLVLRQQGSAQPSGHADQRVEQEGTD